MKTASVFLVAGARPNFVKVAPIFKALARSPRFRTTLVHTGQHYDDDLSGVFFRDLGLPPPDLSLQVGSGSHGAQTGRVLERFEAALVAARPDLVVVVGDVNSTLACALAAAKIVYPSGRRPKVAHVEAGLRSFDRSMPEEINRVMTDAISDFLFTTEESANANLARQGIPRERVFFVGNVMIDTLLDQASRAESLRAWEANGVPDGGYAMLTLHRPSNVDDEATLRRLIEAIRQVGTRIPVLFPVHPRTGNRLRELGLEQAFGGDGTRLIPPLGYLEFLNLVSHSRFVLTDSGGVQEETTVLGIPCLTLRDNTERPVTLEHGTNCLVGTDGRRILDQVERVLAGDVAPAQVPEGWDGRAAERIVSVLEDAFFPSGRGV